MNQPSTDELLLWLRSKKPATKVLLVILCVSIVTLAAGGVAASADLDRSIDETELAPGESTTVTVTVTAAEESRMEVIEEFDPGFAEVVIQDTNPDPVIESVRDQNDGLAVFWEETDTATITYEVTVPEDADAGDTFELSGAETTTTIEVVEEKASVSITTGDADDITDSSVTVLGEVTELEPPTEATVTVEYGAHGDLDNTVSESVGETGDIEIDLDGLESDTTYEYRFTVEAGGVSDEGTTNEFVTDTSEQDDDDGNGDGGGAGSGGGATVYVGTEGPLYAIDAETGEEVWNFPIESVDDTESLGWVESSPTVVNGTVFFTTHDVPGGPGPKLLAVDAATGEEEWRNRYAAGSWSSSPTVVNGTVYVGGGSVGLHALDAETGEIEWKYEAESYIEPSPNVVGDRVYVGSWDENIYALDAETGKKEWAVETDGRVRGSLTATDNLVYAGSADGGLYAINMNGTVEWKVETGDEISTAPVVASGIVYISTSDGNLYAVDAKSGDNRWTFDEADEFRAAPTIHSGNVYAGSVPDDGPSLYVLDAETGEINWEGFSDVRGDRISDIPTVIEDTVYVTLDSGIIAVSSEEDDLEWSFTSDRFRFFRTAPTVTDNPINGQSVGSRVELGTLGHHDVWAERAEDTEEDESSDDDTSSDDDGGGGGGGGGGAPVPDDVNLKVGAAEVTIAEEAGTVDVVVPITNTGGPSETQPVELEINGEVTAIQDVSIGSGGEITVEFSDVDISELSDGEYTYRISTNDDTHTDTLTIGAADSPDEEETTDDSPDEEETTDDATAEPTDTPEEEPIIDEDTPGFGAVVALVALIMSTLLVSLRELLD